MVDKRQFTPRQVLADNLRACMRLKDGPKSQLEMKRRSGVAQATIGRILSARGENARIETVDKLARIYGLEGWQLMVPGMDPGNPPVLMAATASEKALYERLRAAVDDIAKLERK